MNPRMRSTRLSLAKGSGRDVNVIEKGEKGFDGVAFLRRVDAAHLPLSTLSASSEIPEALEDKVRSVVKKWVKAAEELEEPDR